MLSRALSLATVLLLIGCWAVGRAEAQENLEAGKTPSQIFAGTCNACHKSPRGLLKTVSPSSLPGFLRQHYTTSPNMAGVLASYLVSNGATDTRVGGDAPRGAKGAKEGAKEGAKQEARQEPQRPNGPPEQLDRWGRRIHPATAPQEAAAPTAEPKPEAETPALAALEHGPDGRKMSPKQKLSKRGKPGEALPKEEPAASAEPPKAEEKPSETAAKEEGKPESKPETPKPAEEGHSQSARIEQPAETPAIRPDPVPVVTPAPPTTAAVPATTPAATSPAATPASTATPSASTPSTAAPAPAQAVAALPATEMAVPLPPSAVPAPPPAPAVTASAPLPPVAPAGPPAPPISQ